MSRIRTCTSIAAIILVAGCIRAAAADTPAAQVPVDSRLIESLPINELGVNWFFQDVKAVTPANPSGFITPVDGAVIGLGIDYRRRLSLSSNWYWHLGGEYGVGSERAKISGPTFTFEDKTSFKTYQAQLGLGYIQPITPRVDIYATGGLVYTNTKAKFEGPTTSEDGPGYAGYGLTKSLGGRYHFGGKNSLFCENYSSFTWNHVKDGNSELNQTVKIGCYRAGVAFGF